MNNTISWIELKKYHNWRKIQKAIEIALREREKEKLRGSRRSLETLLRLGELARKVVEYYESTGKLVFKVDDKGSIVEVVWKVDEI